MNKDSFYDYLCTEFMNTDWGMRTHKDDLPDAVGEWMVEFDVDTWLYHSERYALQAAKHALKDIKEAMKAITKGA